jgi:hypothetical protein
MAYPILRHLRGHLSLSSIRGNVADTPNYLTLFSLESAVAVRSKAAWAFADANAFNVNNIHAGITCWLTRNAV